MTMTLKPHIAVLPAASDVLHVTSVSPNKSSKKSQNFNPVNSLLLCQTLIVVIFSDVCF